MKFQRLSFVVGGGLGLGKDDVAAYVGNSYHGVAGAGYNFNRLFGVDAEYMWYDLNFRPGVKETQSLSGQTGNMQSFSLDGVVKVPYHLGRFGAYGIFGIGFYERTVSVPSRVLQYGTEYEPAWRWWDLQKDPLGNVITQTMSSNTEYAGGFNYGGGVTYRLNRWHNAKVFGEFRYHRAYHADGQTIVMPITVGLRW